MDKKKLPALYLPLSAIFLFITLGQSKAFEAFLYKNYIVKCDRGIEILCDSYVVQRNDWIFKVFRKKGEISTNDYPEFLQIFKRINPHIHNPDLIRPGQSILIPLKKLSPGDLPGQSKGIVTIPYVTSLDIDDVLSEKSVKYQIKKGDSVSKIVSKKFGAYGTFAYNQGIKIFKHINPDIKNLNMIYVGDYVNIPDPLMKNEQWYKSLFNDSDRNTNDLKKENINISDQTLSSMSPEVSMGKKREKQFTSPLSDTVNLMGARLINKGNYYFPSQKSEDNIIDLANFPVIELEWGSKIVCSIDKSIPENIKKAIISYWNDVKFVTIAENDSSETILNKVLTALKQKNEKNTISFKSDSITTTIKADWIIEKHLKQNDTNHKVCIFLIENSDEKTHPSISHYLALNNIIVKDHIIKNNENKKPESEKNLLIDLKKDLILIDANSNDNKIFVKDLVSALGLKYTPNVSVSFKYAGIYMQSILSQISTETGGHLLVDFGDIYGDAVKSIRNTGFEIIQILKKDDNNAIIKKLFTALNLPFTTNPTFFVAKRPEQNNISLTIPGFLTTKSKIKILVSTISLPDDVINFLQDKNIKIITATNNIS